MASMDPTAGAAVVIANEGNPLMAGADPAGHLTKKGVTIVTTAVAD